MSDKHSYPIDPLIKIIIEKIFTILVCSFIIFIGNHSPELWNTVITEIGVSFLFYYIAYGVAFYSIYRMVIAIVMIWKHDYKVDKFDSKP